MGSETRELFACVYLDVTYFYGTFQGLSFVPLNIAVEIVKHAAFFSSTTDRDLRRIVDDYVCALECYKTPTSKESHSFILIENTAVTN